MIIRQEQWEIMKADIMKKAKNNKDLEAYIHPSDYGFGKKNEDTQVVKDFLSNQPEIKSVEFSSKDLLRIRVWDVF